VVPLESISKIKEAGTVVNIGSKSLLVNFFLGLTIIDTLYLQEQVSFEVGMQTDNL
jgi:hypothetical protein